MVEVTIKQDRKKCVGCGACVTLCPMRIWQMCDGKAYPSKPWNRCIYCLRCQENCPVQIIKIIPKDKTIKPIKKFGSVYEDTSVDVAIKEALKRKRKRR